MRTQFICVALVIVLVCDTASAQWAQTRTVVQLPDSVALVEPANNVTLLTSMVRFVWQSSQAEVVRYWFELATDSSFVSSVADTAVIDTTKDWIQLSNVSYWWRVKAGNLAGWGPFSEIWTFRISACGVDDLSSIPKEFSLVQSFPNPFNLSTTIRYELLNASNVTLILYNMLGQEVATLVDEAQGPDYKSVQFDGSRLASGVYFYRLQAGDPSTSSGQVFVATKRLLLLK
jgi:hypothetical protein